MKPTRHLGRGAAAVGILAASVIGPFASAANASSDVTAESVGTSADAASEWYGPYDSQGTCNYWEAAMRNAGYRTSGCFDLTLRGDWYFIVY
jgi:hypothetical protein